MTTYYDSLSLLEPLRNYVNLFIRQPEECTIRFSKKRVGGSNGKISHPTCSGILSVFPKSMQIALVIFSSDGFENTCPKHKAGGFLFRVKFNPQCPRTKSITVKAGLQFNYRYQGPAIRHESTERLAIKRVSLRGETEEKIPYLHVTQNGLLQHRYAYEKTPFSVTEVPRLFRPRIHEGAYILESTLPLYWGSLYDYINTAPRVPCLDAIHQALNCLESLSRAGIIHNDPSPANALIGRYTCLYERGPLPASNKVEWIDLENAKPPFEPIPFNLSAPYLYVSPICHKYNLSTDLSSLWSITMMVGRIYFPRLFANLQPIYPKIDNFKVLIYDHLVLMKYKELKVTRELKIIDLFFDQFEKEAVFPNSTVEDIRDYYVWVLKLFSSMSQIEELVEGHPLKLRAFTEPSPQLKKNQEAFQKLIPPFKALRNLIESSIKRQKEEEGTVFCASLTPPCNPKEDLPIYEGPIFLPSPPSE